MILMELYEAIENMDMTVVAATRENRSWRFPTRSDTNRPVQL